MDCATGWLEKLSQHAAISKSSALLTIFGWMSSTANTPFVSVPVLSKTTVSILDKTSIYPAPFMRIPSLDAPPIPPKKDRGTDTTSAQGHDTTRNTQALVSQIFQTSQSPIPMNNGGTTARITAAITTAGV